MFTFHEHVLTLARHKIETIDKMTIKTKNETAVDGKTLLFFVRQCM